MNFVPRPIKSKSINRSLIINNKYMGYKKIVSALMIIYIFNSLFLVFNVSATTVELLLPETLDYKIEEGKQINFTIMIKDIEYKENDFLTLNTNLVASQDKSIYDFGELNKYITENRYQQKIKLNLSSLPKKDIIYITITGSTPNGEIKTKCDNDLVLIKFHEGKLKLYEAYIDDKLVGVETYELINKKKENFENTIQQINWDELDSLKYEIRNLFDLGLAIEAQNLATEMSDIKRPDNLKLFKIIHINNNLWLNLITLAVIIICFFIGYIIGSRNGDE